jgi:hypothetical protein
VDFSREDTALERGNLSTSRDVPSRKNEKERMEQFAAEVASLKDTVAVQDKRFGELMDERFDRMFRRLGTHQGDTVQAMVQMNHSLREGEPKRQVTLRGETTPGPCWYCLEFGHLIRDCLVKLGHIDRGMIVIEQGQLRLGKGKGFIPRFPLEWSRAKRVEDFWLKNPQGLGQDAATASMMSATYESDSLDSVYDSRDDELRSLRVQNALLANSRYEAPQVASWTHQQAPVYPGVTYNQPSQTQFIPMAQPQFVQTMPPQPVTMAPAQTITSEAAQQFINLVNQYQQSMNNGQNVHSQLITTRKGTTTEPPAGPNF